MVAQPRRHWVTLAKQRNDARRKKKGCTYPSDLTWVPDHWLQKIQPGKSLEVQPGKSEWKWFSAWKSLHCRQIYIPRDHSYSIFLAVELTSLSGQFRTRIWFLWNSTACLSKRHTCPKSALSIRMENKWSVQTIWMNGSWYRFTLMFFQAQFTDSTV